MSEPAQMRTHHVQHRELLVQVQINRGSASDGGSGTSADASRRDTGKADDPVVRSWGSPHAAHPGCYGTYESGDN